MWAAIWLYKATGTQTYLTYATNGYSSYGFSGSTDVLSWDSKIAGIKILLAQITGQASYIQDVQNLCNYFTTQAPRSPLGEVFLSQWGSLRYAANAAYICLLVSNHHFFKLVKCPVYHFCIPIIKTSYNINIQYCSNMVIKTLMAWPY